MNPNLALRMARANKAIKAKSRLKAHRAASRRLVDALRVAPDGNIIPCAEPTFSSGAEADKFVHCAGPYYASRVAAPKEWDFVPHD